MGIISLIQSMPDPIPEDCRALCHRSVFPRLVMTSILWFTISYQYYGLSLVQPPPLFGEDEVGQVLTWCFGFIIEIPAYMAASYLIARPKWGRKGVVCLCTIMAGGACTVTGIQEWAPASLYRVFESLYWPAR